jgi:hypothetical protein
MSEFVCLGMSLDQVRISNVESRAVVLRSPENRIESTDLIKRYLPFQNHEKLVRISSYYNDASVGIATGYELDSNPGTGKRLFSTASRRPLGPTQRLIQWVPGGEAAGE